VQRECDAEKVEAVIRDDPEALAAFREAMLGKPGRPKEGETRDNVTGLDDDRGNSRAYSISRVQRECDPDTVSAVMAGEHHARRLTAPALPGRRARLQAVASNLFGGHEIAGLPAFSQNLASPSTMP